MAKTTRHIGTCGACEKATKVRNGKLVHHGYERPGYGYIEGDCFGVHYEPHEVSPKCSEEYREMVLGLQEVRQKDINGLPDVTEVTVDIGTLRRPREETYRRDSEDKMERYRFKEALESRKHSLERQRNHWKSEVERMGKLLLDWAPKALVSVEEEKAAKRVAKAVREAERKAKREAKVADIVAKAKKRVASAQKRRTASVFLQVFETAPTKIREAMNYDVTRIQAYEALGMNEAWKTLGLLTPEGEIVHVKNEGRYVSYDIPYEVRDDVEARIKEGVLDKIPF